MATFGITEALLIAGVVAAAGSAAATVVSANQAANAQAEAAQATSGYNVAAAQIQADQARDSAALEEEASRQRFRRAQSANRAAIAASGVELEGTPLLVLMDNASQAEYEAQRIKYAGETAAAGYESTANLERYYGQQGQQAASNMRAAGYTAAGTSLLGSAASLGQAYYTPRLRVGQWGYGSGSAAP